MIIWKINDSITGSTVYQYSQIMQLNILILIYVRVDIDENIALSLINF